MNAELGDFSTYDSSFSSEDSLYVKGGWLRIFVGIVFLIFAIAAFASDISKGHYFIKLFVLGSACLLIFSPESYPFLLGLIVPTYFELKAGQLSSPEISYMIQLAYVLTTLMAIMTFLKKKFGGVEDKARGFDLCSICLFGIFLISIAGFIVMNNKFLFFRRVMEILGFCSAFYLGRSYINTLAGLKLLLIGLFLGLFAFVLPWSVGFVMREGFSVLGSMHLIRKELGTGSAARETGITAIMFALAYSIKASGFSSKLKRIAFWLVAVPSVLSTLIYLSRAAIILIPATVIMTTFFSGRKVAAIWTLIISCFLGLLILQFSGELGVSIQARMLTMQEAGFGRQYIWSSASKIGVTHPLVGIGAGQFIYVTTFWHAHNDELTIFAEHGAIAMILYIVFWINLGLITFKLLLSKDVLERGIAGSFAVVAACYIVYAQIQPLYFNRAGMLFTFLAGMTTRLYLISRSDHNEDEYPLEQEEYSTESLEQEGSYHFV